MALTDIVFSPHHACRKTHEEWLFALLRRNGGEVCILELGRKYKEGRGWGGSVVFYVCI